MDVPLSKAYDVSITLIVDRALNGMNACIYWYDTLENVGVKASLSCKRYNINIEIKKILS